MSSEKPDKAPKIQSVFSRDCAILLGESLTPVVVAKALDKNSLIFAKFRILRPQDCDPFLGYTIEVDLEKGQVRNEALGFGVRYDCRRLDLDAELATRHVINVKLPRDVTIVVESARQTLPKYTEIFIEGFGLPFSDREHPQLEDWLRGDQPIAAGFSLVDIIKQKKISLFMDLSVDEVKKKFLQPLPEPSKFPYQTVGAKFDDYRGPVRMHRGHQYTPNFVLDSDDDHNIVVNHAVAQDIIWIYEIALEIKARKRPMYFAVLDEPSVSLNDKKKFYVVLSLTDDFMTVYGDAWRRLATSGKVEVSLYESDTGTAPCEEWDGTIIKHPETIPRFVECHVPNAETELVMLIEPSKRPCKESAPVKRQNWATIYIDPGVLDAERKLFATDSYLRGAGPLNVAGWDLARPRDNSTPEQLQRQAELAVQMHLHRVFVRGAGFWEWQMKGSGVNVPRSLPVVNFLDLGNPALVKAIVEEALPEDRARWTNYLQRRLLGFGIIAAAPGTGKTTTMASAVLAVAARFGKVLCSAPTHVATTNFAERIYKRSCAVVERYKANTGKEAPSYRRLAVVRGYKMEFELTATKALLRDPSLGDAAVPEHMFEGNSKWKLHLSATYWLLMVLGSPAVRKLENDDSAGLWALRNCRGSEPMARLRALAQGKMSWAAFNQAGGMDDKTIVEIIRGMIPSVDVLCVTPAAAYNEPGYSSFKSFKARAIAIDEAGNMNCADLYNVWGNTMHPCFLGGDPKQLPPAVMSSMDKGTAEGEYRNRFAKYGRVSALLKFQAMGMPMYRLNQQLRMAKGMFDIASAVIYPDVPFTYNASCNISRPEFKIGRDLETYLRKVYPGLAAPPTSDILRPVFLHCPKSTTVVDPVTSSKMNPDQVTVALNTVAGFVKAMKVDPARISMIAPYAANVVEIKEQLKRRQYEQIRGMPSPSTVDSFQGQENDIIVLVLGTTVASGPGFTVDAARLNVALTRPRSGLIIVGDINAAGPLMDSNGKLNIKAKDAAKQTFEIVDAEGNVCVRKAPALRSVFTTLVKDGRVVTVS
ncbi:hypothetical protein NHJ6243_005752 [Beauveria neobassiana]